MFNWAGSSYRYNNFKTLGGVMAGDYQTHKTMFAGPDPADPSKVLVRKLVQTSDHVWCFEESRISASANGKQPSVHTTIHRLGNLDMNEDLSKREREIRRMHRPRRNIIGFTVYTKAWDHSSGVSWTLAENSYYKAAGYRWQEWWADLQDRRNISSYMKLRWTCN